MKTKLEIVIEPHSNPANGWMAELWQVAPSRQMVMAVRQYSTGAGALRMLLAELQKEGWAGLRHLEVFKAEKKPSPSPHART